MTRATCSPIAVRVVARVRRPGHAPGRRRRHRAAFERGVCAGLALGHRRFSIIDPTPAGHQPFVDAAGTCAVVFNGEIYNYVELRDELAADGVQFRTDTDTEVLVEAYKRWGRSASAGSTASGPSRSTSSPRPPDPQPRPVGQEAAVLDADR
jgi:hypothetical protein